MDIKERKQKANSLRKSGELEQALQFYRDLWKETQDEFDGAGFLHCLRKLGVFDEAIPLAEEISKKHLDFEWCRREVVWTYIGGVLQKYHDNESIETFLDTANKILDLNPDELAIQKVVFIILKKAKQSDRWDIVNIWLTKIDPNKLSEIPIKDSAGHDLWSDQALWYNYHLNGLLFDKEYDKVIKTVDQIQDRFPRHRKLFLRLKGRAFFLSGNLLESEQIYSQICAGNKADWWLLHEYAQVVRDLEKRELALQIMCQASCNCFKIESAVNMFVDMSLLYREINKYEEAREHLVLSKLLRMKKEWKIPNAIITGINELNELIGNNAPDNFQELLKECQKKWNEGCLIKPRGKRTESVIRKGCHGSINLGLESQPFCFIYAGKEQFYCKKIDLPKDTKDKDLVTFDAIPSFDKKKNKESWKAVNIRLTK